MVVFRKAKSRTFIDYVVEKGKNGKPDIVDSVRFIEGTNLLTKEQFESIKENKYFKAQIESGAMRILESDVELPSLPFKTAEEAKKKLPTVVDTAVLEGWKTLTRSKKLKQLINDRISELHEPVKTEG